MPFIAMPDSVTVPEMDVSKEPDTHSSWTRQPGTDDFLHTVVVGPAAEQPRLPFAAAAHAEHVVAVARTGGGTVVKLRPYQEDAIQAVVGAWNGGARAPLIVMPTGCHRAGQGVLMFDGRTKRVEDVAVDDLLLGPDGSARTVLALCRGTGPMFRVVPKKGAPFVVNDEHVLSLVRTNENSAATARFPCRRRGGEIVDLTVREYESKSKWFKHIHKLYRSTEIEFGSERASLPIDPYFVGLYLTDGSMAVDGQVGVSKPDPEVEAACHEEAAKWGLRVRTTISPSGGCPTHHIAGERSGGRVPNGLLDALRAMQLMGIPSEARFVPDAYKYGSAETRRAVLAGLLDGDGSLGTGVYDFISKSRTLSEDVAFIARSLGQAAYVGEAEKNCQNGFVGIYWRVCLSGDFTSLPMRIPRKIAPPRKQKKDVLRLGFTLENLQSEESFYGFTLDGDHRYLLDDFTVCHNSGKTLVAAELMARSFAATRKKCLFVAQREELLDQTMDKIRLVSPITRVGLVQAKHNDLGREITVASVQTLAPKSGDRLRALIESGPYAMLIIDEAHHSVSPSHVRVINALREANQSLLMCGMTATPGREDGIALDRVFDVVAYERNTFEMIRDGWLVPPRIFSQEIDVDLDQVDTEGGDYVAAKLSKVMNTPYVNRAVVEAWRKYGMDRKCLVFCCDVAHAKALAQEFIDAGYPAAHVDGTMKKKDRQRALDDFREGKTKLLCNCSLLTEGYDEPSAEGVVLARPTQSQALAIQIVGRALRLYPGKTEAIVIDCVGNSERHRPVQLATLAGFDPERRYVGRDKGFGEEAEDVEPEGQEPEVVDARLGEGREVAFSARAKRSNYQWRETSVGWILQIPRVGYYLVAWSDKAHHMATIRFYDQRKGHRDDPAREVVRQPVDFEMAYGLVEGEMDRMFRASTMRKALPEIDDTPPIAAFVDLDEGVDEDVNEEYMLKDAEWRQKPITGSQRAALLKHGFKEKSIPETAGEASDMIAIVRAERDMKMRLPATAKQIGYLRVNGLPVGEGLTKGQAASIIWKHRRDTGR